MDAPLSALRVYSATPSNEPVEIRPPDPGQPHWTRQSLAHWLAEELLDNPATIVGIDHALGFPEQYRDAHDFHGDWEQFVEDFKAHWPTHEPKITVEYIRKGVCGSGAERAGDPDWRRLCEGDVRKQFHSKALLGSVPRATTLRATLFDFEAPDSVAEATHAGLPWLGYLREQLGEELHLWPMDGWVPDEDRSLIAEVHPSLLNAVFPSEDRTIDQQKAYTTTRWMRETDAEDELLRALHPVLIGYEVDVARREGWILGVGPLSKRNSAEKTHSTTAKEMKKPMKPTGSKKASAPAGKGKKLPATKKAAKGGSLAKSSPAKKASQVGNAAKSTAPVKKAKDESRAKPAAEKKAAGKGSAATKPAAKSVKSEAGKPAGKVIKNSRVRERIHEFADKLHGKLVTQRQLFFLEAALGSLDDTLDEIEVLSILESMPPDFSMPPRDQLRLIHIDGDFKITTFPAPPAPHDPDAYCRRNPRR